MANANRRYRDMFWYIVIGLLVILAIVVLVVWVPDRRLPNHKWTQFAFYSSLLFVFLSKIYWRYRYRLKLWLLIFAAIAVHLSAYLPLLWRIDYSPSLWYVVVMPLEAMLVMIVLWLLLRIPPDVNVRL
jgi:hypothetical protein